MHENFPSNLPDRLASAVFCRACEKVLSRMRFERPDYFASRSSAEKHSADLFEKLREKLRPRVFMSKAAGIRPVLHLVRKRVLTTQGPQGLVAASGLASAPGWSSCCHFCLRTSSKNRRWLIAGEQGTGSVSEVSL